INLLDPSFRYSFRGQRPNPNVLPRLFQPVNRDLPNFGTKRFNEALNPLVVIVLGGCFFLPWHLVTRFLSQSSSRTRQIHYYTHYGITLYPLRTPFYSLRY